MIKEKKGVYVASKVPALVRSSIERAVDDGSYLNISDFIRSAVKEKVLKEGYLSKQARPGD
jgi:Arc/MetJ-type ribon-helix-helix transcriptional regulator